jgi:hypothetical protein
VLALGLVASGAEETLPFAVLDRKYATFFNEYRLLQKHLVTNSRLVHDIGYTISVVTVNKETLFDRWYLICVSDLFNEYSRLLTSDVQW